MLNKIFAVVDLETTGNNLEKDNIIQLALCSYVILKLQDSTILF